MGKSRQLATQVRDLVDAVVVREGFELVDVEFVADQGRNVLRMYIDTIPPGNDSHGIGVDDCALISRVVGDLLDVEDQVDDNYTLEVSSPGLFRPLTRPAHFDRAVGNRIKVKTYEKLDGRKVFTGVLAKHAEGAVTVDVDGTPFTLELENVAKANLEPLLQGSQGK